ncbi:MAG TPA: zf-HC2 domain-containing protein [Chloroflexota bacterium]|jgi:anti-sigma factor RsiW
MFVILARQDSVLRRRQTAGPSPHLTCAELVALVTEYLEGALPVRERARFEAHLALCRDCRDHLEQMRRTIRLLGRLTEESIPPSSRERLLETFRSWRR